jgi:RNA exonuclease 1
MCYTTKGLELTRVSIIDTNLNLIYDQIVLPDYKIIDYNTRWSGLTESDFKSCRIKLKDVQDYLLKLFNQNTILIGHSLESDFKALKVILHTNRNNSSSRKSSEFLFILKVNP